MNAAPNRRQEFNQAEQASAPAASRGLAAALASDWLYFAQNPGRRYCAREATAAEIQIVQILEKRLLELEEICEAVALVHLTDQGHRRRVVIESCNLDLEAMSDDSLGALFTDIVEGGWVAIEGRQS